MKRAVAPQKRAIWEATRATPFRRGKRCFLTSKDGWTTVSRKPLPNAVTTRQPPTRRFPRNHGFSKSCSFFPSPPPAELPLLRTSLAVSRKSPLTHAPIPMTAKLASTLFSRHRNPSLFKPPTARDRTHSTPSFKQVLLSNPTMVRNNPQLGAASAKTKNQLSLMRKTVANLPPPPPKPREGWNGRCFRCHKSGHSRAECSALQPICGRCRKHGHETAKCRSKDRPLPSHVDPLEPTGNIGDSRMPVTRPQIISTFVPQTRDSYRDIRYLQRAVVVDARLWPAHDPAGVQARLMAAAGTDTPFELTDLDGSRYVAILPEGLPRQQFIRDFSPALESFSLVCYPWNSRLGMSPVNYLFKVWVDLIGVPLMAWNMEHLIPMLSPVGLILDHTSFEQVKSINKLRVVIAVKDLARVPQAIQLAIRGLAAEITVTVVGWDYHHTTVNLPVDPTPPDSYFLKVQDNLFKQPLISAQPDTSAKMIPVDADVLFQWWDKLEDGEHKKSMETMLRASPFWTLKEKKRHAPQLGGESKFSS